MWTGADVNASITSSNRRRARHVGTFPNRCKVEFHAPPPPCLSQNLLVICAALYVCAIAISQIEIVLLVLSSSLLLTSSHYSLPLRMTGLRAAFALSKEEVNNATPPGTATLIGRPHQTSMPSCLNMYVQSISSGRHHRQVTMKFVLFPSHRQIRRIP